MVDKTAFIGSSGLESAYGAKGWGIFSEMIDLRAVKYVILSPIVYIIAN